MSDGTDETLNHRGVLRRAFFAQVSGALVAGVVFHPSLRLAEEPVLSAKSAGPLDLGEPVVGFHLDRPYLDVSGTALPYCPPRGTRSGQWAAELTEEEFLIRHGYA